MNSLFPVLIYHSVIGTGGSNGAQSRKYTVSEEKFIEQLSEIHRLGMAVRPLKTAWSNGHSSEGLSPVVLTFDDGLASAYETIFPLLLREGIEADFFVNPASLGNAGYLSWEQIVQMRRYGMAIHSHSQEHIDLTQLSTETLTRHLRSSKQCLEDRLGCGIDFLAAPYGLLNHRVFDVAAQEGYLGVCNSENRLAVPGAANINRIAIYRHTPLRTFGQFLEQRALPYSIRKLRSALLYLPKQILRRTRPEHFGLNVVRDET